MTIELKPEHSQVIDQAIQAGLITNASDVLDIAVETLRERLKSQDSPVTVEQWKRELHDWIHSHSQAAPLLSDDAISRESIYRERGL